MELTPSTARTILTYLRLALGGIAWLAPRQTARLFGIDPDENPAAPFLGRLFAIRDVAMGAALLEGDEAETDRWIDYGIAVDAADAVAAVAGGIRGYLPKRAAVMVVLAATSGVALGVVARDR